MPHPLSVVEEMNYNPEKDKLKIHIVEGNQGLGVEIATKKWGGET